MKLEAFEIGLRIRHSRWMMTRFLESIELKQMIKDLDGVTFNLALETD